MSDSEAREHVRKHNIAWQLERAIGGGYVVRDDRSNVVGEGWYAVAALVRAGVPVPVKSAFEAEDVARAKLGPRAAIFEDGATKEKLIGMAMLVGAIRPDRSVWLHHRMEQVCGRGSSWSEAMRQAGVAVSS